MSSSIFSDLSIIQDPDSVDRWRRMQPLVDEHEAIEARSTDREVARRQAEASLPDSHFAAVPVPGGPFSLTGLVRHARLLTGFSFDEIERLCLVSADEGAFERLAIGDPDPDLPQVGSYESERLRDLVNVSRAVKAAFGPQEIRPWWWERRHGKKYCPAELLSERRLRDKIFGAYQDELTASPGSIVHVIDASIVESPHRIPGFELGRF